MSELEIITREHDRDEYERRFQNYMESYENTENCIFDQHYFAVSDALPTVRHSPIMTIKIEMVCPCEYGAEHTIGVGAARTDIDGQFVKEAHEWTHQPRPDWYRDDWREAITSGERRWDSIRKAQANGRKCGTDQSEISSQCGAGGSGG